MLINIEIKSNYKKYINVHFKFLLSKNFFVLNYKSIIFSTVFYILSIISISPNSASIIFWTSNNSVSTVVKSAWKNIILMTIKALYLYSRVGVPNSAGFVATCSN